MRTGLAERLRGRAHAPAVGVAAAVRGSSGTVARRGTSDAVVPRGASAGAATGSPARTPSVPGARQRVFLALRRGATVNAAAVEAGVPLALAEVMVDEMRRTGLLEDATSLCASGLGACHGGHSEEVRIHCAGCPILPLSPSRQR